MRSRSSLLLVTLVCLAASASAFACSSSNAAPGPGDPGLADGGADAHADDADADAGSACTGSPLRVFDETAGIAQRYYVDLPIDGRTAPFLLDTGSPATFRYTSTDVDDAGPTAISCVPVDLPGYSGAVGETTPDGDDVEGTLGADLVSRGAVLDLNIAEKRFVWWKTAPPPPPNATVLPIAFDTKAYALVVSDIELDGKKVRLVLDTGSPHVLFMSATPRAGETEIHTLDGAGNPVVLDTSTISLALGGGAPETVAVDRAAKFPSLELLLGQLGGADIVGLLGIGALGHQHVVISKTSLAFVR